MYLDCQKCVHCYSFIIDIIRSCEVAQDKASSVMAEELNLVCLHVSFLPTYCAHHWHLPVDAACCPDNPPRCLTIHLIWACVVCTAMLVHFAGGFGPIIVGTKEFCMSQFLEEDFEGFAR